MKQQMMTLMAQGMAALEAGDYAKAESCLSTVAQATQAPEVVENWAACRLQSGDYAGALEALAPLLRAKAPLPYGRTMASLARRALGQTDAALMVLHIAVRDLDKLLGLQPEAIRPDRQPLAAHCG